MLLLVSTTCTLMYFFQLDGGIGKKQEYNIPCVTCEHKGKLWLRRQPQKFDWFFSYICQPVHSVDPAGFGNNVVAHERLSNYG